MGKIVKSPKDFVVGKKYSTVGYVGEAEFRFSHLDFGGDPAFFDDGQLGYTATYLGFHHFFFRCHKFKEVKHKNRIGK